ncbi:MAG: hypothetical protein QUV06_05010, partial [Cyanobium sp. CZS 48M]|nr:hypothetical protein [Cyanobium sp. CZS48M]
QIRAIGPRDLHHAKGRGPVEFGSGSKITDTFGFLEGTGKGRRHVKLMSVAQIKDKKLAQYLSLALHASKQDDS